MSGAEQGLPDGARDLHVLPRGDDERANRGARRADVRLVVAGAASFARASSAMPRNPSPSAAAARIFADRSPTPPVNAIASSPSSDAAIAAIEARSRWR